MFPLCASLTVCVSPSTCLNTKLPSLVPADHIPSHHEFFNALSFGSEWTVNLRLFLRLLFHLIEFLLSLLVPAQQVLDYLVCLIEVAVICHFDYQSTKALILFSCSNFDVFSDVFFFEVGRIKFLDFHLWVHIEFGLESF